MALLTMFVSVWRRYKPLAGLYPTEELLPASQKLKVFASGT